MALHATMKDDAAATLLCDLKASLAGFHREVTLVTCTTGRLQRCCKTAPLIENNFNARDRATSFFMVWVG